MTFSITHPLLGQSVEDRILTASQELRLVELQESAEATRSEATLTLIGAYVDLAAEQRHRELRTQALVLATEKVRVLEERAARGEILQRDVLAAKADLADRRAEAAEGARREVELLADIAVLVDGEAPGPFRAGALDWAKMMPAASMPPPAVKAPAPAISRGVRSSVWYNLPEIDLRFYYSIASRDRTFADEVDDEEGHIPGIEVTLEFPLELWRSGKSFARQVEARHERQRLAVLAIQRETAGRATAAAMAHAEAAARLAAAEAKLALREEDRRVARLKADDVGASAVRSELNMIAAELAVIDSQVDVAFEQGELARRYFERGMVEGSNPIELAMATSCSPCRERVAEAAPAVGRESGL
jgi:outer membrane protein TolC